MQTCFLLLPTGAQGGSPLYGKKGLPLCGLLVPLSAINAQMIREKVLRTNAPAIMLRANALVIVLRANGPTQKKKRANGSEKVLRASAREKVLRANAPE